MKTAKLTGIFWVVSILCLFGTAFADEQVIGSGGPLWHNQKTFSDASPHMSVSNATSAAALFPAGEGSDSDRTLRPGEDVAHMRTSGVFSANELGVCCWVGDLAITTSTTGFITDPGSGYSNGPGACFSVGSSHDVRVNSKPNRLDMVTLQVPGYRSGICSVSVSYMNMELYAPCDEASDCAGRYGGGSCTTSNLSQAQKNKAGMFLRCIDNGDDGFNVRAFIDAVRTE